MASTEFGTTNAHTVERWSNSLTRETFGKMLISKLLGTGPEAVMRYHRDLVRGAGDTINVPMRTQDRTAMRSGDEELTNFETSLTFYNQAVYIDQGRKAHEARGMSQQRVNFNLQPEARSSLSSYWAYIWDSLTLAMLAGDAGDVASNTECVSNYLGVGGNWAGNAITAADAAHIYDPSETGRITHLDACLEKMKTANPRVEPTIVDGKPYYVGIFHPRTIRYFRTEANTAVSWYSAHQQAGPRSDMNPIFTGALGVYNGIVLHESEFIPVQAATPYVWNVILGRCAGHFCVGNAWGAGTSKPAAFKWTQEERDHGNVKSVGSTSIFGIQAAIWNSKRFGSFVYKSDCAAAS